MSENDYKRLIGMDLIAIGEDKCMLNTLKFSRVSALLLGCSMGTISALIGAAGVSLLAPLPAWSADSSSSPPPAPGARSARADVEEIVVTARRREENIQNVPIAITVISPQSLQDNNVHTLGDLQYLVPSLSMNTSIDRNGPSVYIRGQGTGSSSSLPGVVTYLNEVPIPSVIRGELSGGPGLFFDLENVQVLKGPQGTLFGLNSVGGAVLLQTARPTNDFGGRLQLGYGNHNDREIDGAVNLPIVADKLLARVAFNGQLRDGFTQVVSDPGHPNGIDADNRDYWSVRGTVTFHPVDWLQNDAIATYQKYKSHGTPYFLTAVNTTPFPMPGFGLAAFFFPTFPSFLAQQNALGVRTHIAISTPIESDGNLLSVSNITRVDLAHNLTFRNIFGYERATTSIAADSDGTILPIFDQPYTLTRAATSQFTEEAQVLGKSFGERLNWIAGLFYLHQVPPSLASTIETDVQFGAPSQVEGKGIQGATSKAVFAQGTYDLSPLLKGVSVTGGVRYTWDDRSITQTVGACCSTLLVGEAKSHALSWTIDLDYQVTADTLLYLTSRRGYRGGGPNQPANGLPVPDYNPEFVTDYELGFKSDWKAGNVPVRTNAAIYYQNYTDIQVDQIYYIPGTSPPAYTTIVANAAAARLWGAELEAQAWLTPDLQIGVSFDYLKFEYTRFQTGVDAPQLLLGTTAGRPPYKYGVNAHYHLPLNAQIGDVSVQANWNWQATSGNFENAVGGLIPSFGLLNLSANWDRIGGGAFDASLFASNVLDTVYSIGGLGAYALGGWNTNAYGEPRMYGIRLRYRFGAEGK